MAPALSVQIRFDRRVVAAPDFTLGARSVVPACQDQSTNAYPCMEGGRVSAAISPADGYLSWSDAALVETTLDALVKTQPEVRETGVVESVLLKHKNHLIRPLPGVTSARPAQATSVPNLLLAGNGTPQDDSGSQESAGRSDRVCAEAILAGVPP